jgi:hypothetical protein
MVDSAPTVEIKISNFHYEDVEIKVESSGLAEKDFTRDQKNLKHKRDDIDFKIRELKTQSGKSSEIEALQKEKSNLMKEESLLIE